MDTLFTANIIINGQNKSFDVSFAHDEYIFKPTDTDGMETFSFSRQDDEWKTHGNLNEIEKQQAISALEHYLLSQH
jgi:hypothetical protein